MICDNGLKAVEWNEPTVLSLQAVIIILKLNVTDSITRCHELISQCKQLPMGNPSEDSSQVVDPVSSSLNSLSVKKVEESLKTYLKLIQKSLRGAAEILGK